MSVNYGIENGELNLSYDKDKDGEPSVSLKVKLNEAIKEAIDRGESVEGARVVDFQMVGSQLVLKLDTDKDGEQVLDLVIDLPEALDESGVLG